MSGRPKNFVRCGICALKSKPCRKCHKEAKEIDAWTEAELKKEKKQRHESI